MLIRALTKGNLVLLSAGGMIGSSWLFSPFISAKIAGPFALYSWIFITIFMVLIALPLCELGTIFPMAGGMVNFPSITHGNGLGFIFGWVTWLSYVVVAPIEVQAVMQYASFYMPFLVDMTHTGFHLSIYGLLVSFLVHLDPLLRAHPSIISPFSTKVSVWIFSKKLRMSSLLAALLPKCKSDIITVLYFMSSSYNLVYRIRHYVC